MKVNAKAVNVKALKVKAEGSEGEGVGEGRDGIRDDIEYGTRSGVGIGMEEAGTEEIS